MMAERILPLADVGRFMNEHFICVKFYMEKGEGMRLARKYLMEYHLTDQGG